MSALPQHVTDYLDLVAELSKERTVARRLMTLLGGAAVGDDQDTAMLEARSSILADIASAATIIELGEHSEESIKAAVRRLRAVLRGLPDAGDTLTAADRARGDR